MVLEIEAFSAERHAFAQRFRHEVEPYVGPSGWFAIGADRIADDLMPFGEHRAFLALESGPDRARIGVENPGVQSQERTTDELPLPLQRMFDEFRGLPVGTRR